MREVAWAAKRTLLFWIAAVIVVLILAVVVHRVGWIDWAAL